jgi:molybdenum cofactor synthesis domain-containing protein
VLVIGNELLTGKIRDENGYFLAGALRRRGIELVEICTVPDDLDRIGSALRRLMGRTPIVFTSGGVGPTHDDRTMAAIARATDRPLQRDAEMEAILREHYGPKIGTAALSMADVPKGTVLRALPGWPVLRLDLDDGPTPGARVYMLPGIPALLRAKFEALEALPDELPMARPWTLVSLTIERDESSLAPLLDQIVRDHSEVEIGSYPRWSRAEDGRLEIEVLVTFESRDATRAATARDALEALLAEQPTEP